MFTFNLGEKLFNSDLILNDNWLIEVDLLEARKNHSDLVYLQHMCNGDACTIYLQPIAFDKEHELKCKVITVFQTIETFYYLQKSNHKDIDSCKIVTKAEYLKTVVNKIR